MGPRDWLVRILNRGEAPEPDPDEVVEAGLVRLRNGPMALAALERAGIEATGFEAFAPGVLGETRSHMRIMVRRSDLAAALECIDDLY